MHEKSDFHWTTKVEKAFKQMKQLIAELPMLTAPMEKEELIVYLAFAKETVSAVLMTEREAKQMPVYFVSRALRGPELNYMSMEKLVPTLVHASKHLKRTNTHKPRMDGVHLCSKIQENVDSRLVANQVNGTYVAKEADMIRYLEKVIALTGSFKAFSIKQIPRSENKKADALSKIASTSFMHLSKKVLVEKLKEKSISEVEILAVVEEEGDTRMTPIFKYLMEETLPADVKKARAIKQKSWLFAVVNETLYKKYFLGQWLRCVGPLQTNYVLKEKLTPITSPWPFYKWGIDIDGPFSEGPGKVKFLIVAMDYFTKRIEAKLVATITGNQIKKFVWDNVVCRFGLPGEIISDNGKQFGTIRSKIGVKNYAVIPAEMCMPTLRTAKVDLVGNNEALEINLDLLEERREEAAIREAKRKLGPKWEGPYEVMETLGKGAYKLRDRDGKQLSRTWNINNLKKCHIHK
nr:reverse transcriptase domain-containing protein [Tanacetum cinerariifolium]